MKNLLLPVVAFALSLIVACGGPKHDGFVISGRFDNAKAHKVYLNKAMGNSLIAVDSTVLINDGTFSFKGTNASTCFYIVSVVSEDGKVTNNIQLLVGPKEQVQLSGNLSGALKQNYLVSGSPESQTIKKLQDHLQVTIKTMDSIATVFREAAGTAPIDSALKSQLDLKNKQTYEMHRQFSKKLIQDNDSSLVGVMALFQHLNRHEAVFNIQNDFELYKTVLKKLAPLYPESELIKSLRMMVTAQQRQQGVDRLNKASLTVGSVAPEIVLPAPDGKEIALSSLRGKYVLLDFWASWCSPCRKENPTLVDNFKKYKRKGFRIYQVSLDKEKEKWTEAIKKDRLTWYHVSDLKHWKSDVAKLYNVRSIPSNFLIDPDGKIVGINLRGDRLGEKLGEIYK